MSAISVSPASPLSVSPAALPTGELLRETLAETKELVRLEVRLAREEVREDLRHLKVAGILLGIATAFAIVALATFGVAAVIALGDTVQAALLVAGIVVLLFAVLGFVGYRLLPKVPLHRTRERLTSDIRGLKEHVK